MKARLPRGFSLVELMVVVAIMGILAGVAIPNYRRFQARAKQTEVKSNLASLGSVKQSFYAENNTYQNSGFNGWEPNKQGYYSYASGTGQILYAKLGSGACDADPSRAVESTTGFVAIGRGNIDNDPACDEWQIDQTQNLTSLVDDVFMENNS